MNSRLLKKLEEIKKEYETSEVCMGEMLDSVSADGFSIEDAHWFVYACNGVGERR